MSFSSRGGAPPSRGRPRLNAAGNSVAAGTVRRGGGPSHQTQPCRYFLRGSCRLGSNCQWSHTTARRTERHPTGNQPSIPNFPGLSNDDFSKVELNQTPGKTFNSLKSYVEDTFKFQTAEQVYRFLSIVCSASSQNTSWTAKDGQLHLHQLVEGNGIVRLADAIRFPKATPRLWSFQRGYIPIFTYLASDWVVKSTMNSDVYALYGLIHSNFEIIQNTVESNMRRLMSARSFRDGPTHFSGKQIFKVMFVTLFEYLTRFKEAPIANPSVRNFAEQIIGWFDEWLVALDSKPPFQDECTTYSEEKREFIIENLQRDRERVSRVINRGQTVVVNNDAQPAYQIPSDADPGLVAALERVFDYDGPGELCETGPRHDNDHAEIELIRIAPTRNELLCEDDPYLPANFFEAPHFHEPRSVERLLDIQFRLLREELTSPIRLAVQLIVEDIKRSRTRVTTLSKLLDAKGGRYVAPASVRESIMFSVFTGVEFEPLELNNRGISVGIEFDTPPNSRARSNRPAVRAEYWQQVSKKRLMQDGLVALIWKDYLGNVDVYVGTVASFGGDLVDCSRKPEGQYRVSIRVSFFDAKANIRIVQALQNRRRRNDTRFLIEAPVFYEGIRPFLEALKREPELLPFAQYLRLQSKQELTRTVIGPPLYSRTPGFSFELKDLFSDEAAVPSLRLNTRDPDSIANARAQLIRSSRMDPSQADAVVDSLTREVALIQGPPGTGKSYTGLELIRVLVKNQIAPILLVAFTNHALDHMLTGILDANITTNIVRLGSRFSIDERLSKYSLSTVERDEGRSRLGSSGKAAYRKMKELEKDMSTLMADISSHKVPASHIEKHISFAYPHHHGEFFTHVPSWIEAIAPKPSDHDEGWETVGESPGQEQSIINFWLKGRDLQFLETRGMKGAKGKSSRHISSHNQFDMLSGPNTGDEDVPTSRENYLQNFMRTHGLGNIPKVPTTTRSLDILLKNPRVWSMSQVERTMLHDTWSVEASDLTHADQIKDFEEFRGSHESASGQHKEITEQLKAEILSRSQIVGCTTTGAAKLISMLSGMGPKVMIVEEAGQVLESHILASLVGSVEHVILIGDPLQLRPNINSYKLATDNPKTGKIYKFDQSLMERLSSSGFPMSQIDVQRRMRPEISSLIRNTLYPNLKDNDRVLSYPNVRGMYKNMFFVSHNHKEAGGGEDSISKHNSFEVDMIYDLVLHLLKQGCYNKPGNIVILAAYLGQIPKLRKKLEEIVTIVIDERDAELLEQHTMDQEETGTVKEVQLSKQVIIRTLDNFQGEEGEVIILSLIRNSGTPFDKESSSLEHVKGRAPIGFLKSLNRTNVGLSRAKHGLYIFGNAPELAQGSQMWSDVLKELNSSNCLGSKLPIACHRHPDYVQWIDSPGMIPIVSPKGGCLQPCRGPLSCGHICPSMCHADDPNHISTKCLQACLRLCPRSHPCDRECWECSGAATNCRFPITNLQLFCGHIHPAIPCYRVSTPENMKCPIRVTKQLPSCGHQAEMPCHKDPTTHTCLKLISKELPHCQHHGTIPCSMDPASYMCQEKVEKQLLRCEHRKQMPCHQDPAQALCTQLLKRELPCGHFLTAPCHEDTSKHICRIEVEKRLPGCTHYARIQCHQDPAKYACLEPVTRSLPMCGHRAQMACHIDVKAYKCQETIEKRFENCTHRRRLICHQLRDPATNLCQERVAKNIPACGHGTTMACHVDPAQYECQQRIERQLSCGHRATVLCRTNPSEHKCQQRTQKQLPFCEHRASMPCHQNPEDYYCTKPCEGTLLCCSGRCSSRCGACHKLNPGETRSDGRMMHIKHPCQRRITCGHVCNKTCGENHSCSSICKEKCQQSCTHSNCLKGCSTPCKPCEEPCIWKCTHTQCTSPCGMACTRLPCDERCTNVMSCGHPCPSVCGEPCEYQTCKTCNEDTLESVLDQLKNIHLNAPARNANLELMNITLPCRHVFTVRELDSITCIHEFYEQDSGGIWTKPTIPKTSGVRNRPMCPRCGGNIDSLRYGRVLKNSNDSILQHNIACNLSERLSKAQEMWSESRKELEKRVISTIRSFGTTSIPIPSENTRQTLRQRTESAVPKGCPTTLDLVQNIGKFHGFPPRHTKAWRKAVEDISETYRTAYDVACEPDPSAQAYDRSIFRLYREELNKSGGTADPTTDPVEKRRQQLASDAAHIAIGQLRPRSSDRFKAEAFWMTIEILVTLGLAISKACDESQDRRGANAICWDNIAAYSLSQACKDAETALSMAQKSRSPNKIVQCQLLILQIQYEVAAHKCRLAIRNELLLNPERRDEYLDMCTHGVMNVHNLRVTVPQDYQGRARRESAAGVNTTRADWVREHFIEPTQNILDAWNNLDLIIDVNMPGWRREDANAERLIYWKPIVQEAAASRRKCHTERFNQCSRGHPYVKGECHVSVGVVWCPECGNAVA